MAMERYGIQVSSDWNNTQYDYASDLYIHQFIDLQASRIPDAVAIVFEQNYSTYRQLKARSDQLALYLQSIGVGPDVLVGIFAERSLELIVGLLAVLKAGAAYVPFDTTYPKERLAFMMKDSGASVLLTHQRLVSDLREPGVNIVCLDNFEEPTIKPSIPLNTKLAPENLAYVIYTSGSTGKPKGAMNTHVGIRNRLLWMQQQYSLTENDCVLQKTPISFDVSVWELFWPLISGAKLIIARPGGHQDTGYLIDLIRSQHITVMHFVPSMLQIFLEAPGVEDCSSLRQVICSGESLSLALTERFFKKLPRVKLDNLYGPTEAAVDVTHWSCMANPAVRAVPIGKPIANTQTYILDSFFEQVPVGEVGELYLGGVQLARGYFGKPHLTAERFIPNPFGSPGSRLYKTGDLARYLDDGNIEFLGRADHQVKIRGNRIELGEIEAVLNEVTSVQETVVLPRQDKFDNQKLLAYIVPKKRETPNVRDLRDFLQRKLPDYMIPSAFIFLEKFPLNPNGKVDRAALPVPDQKRPQLDEPYVPARTDLERYLCGLWQEILSLDRVGIHDRFFELGGDSLQAALFINRVRDKLGEFLYIVTIFESPTIASFASFLSSHYSKSLHRLTPTVEVTPNDGNHRDNQITAEMIQEMRMLVPTLAPRFKDRSAEEKKNPPAIFILSPPRSGTTLLRVMLAGHPEIFAAPELQLLGFNTLMERREAFKGKFSLWLEGTIRVLKEIKGCDAEEAKRIMNDYEKQNLNTKDFYKILQDWVAPRILSDKSPTYVLDLQTLKSAEENFQAALYIHLLRHPYSMVRSFEAYHFDQVLYMRKHSFSPRQLGELVWLISHQNALSFLKSVPEERQYRMKFEELVNDPEHAMKEMCRKINLEFHPDLLRPYENTDKKITDGLYSVSTPMGDTKFLERKQIDPKIAETSNAVVGDNFLSEHTWEVAELLGYDRPSERHEERLETSRRHVSGQDLLRRQKQIRTRHREVMTEEEKQNA